AQSSKLYAKVYSGTTTLWDATETLLTPNSPANYYYYNAYSLSTNGVGYAVSWTSNVSSDDSGFVNIYKNGSWLGEQSIESGSTNIGNYSYNGAPQVASNGSSYLTVWGQLNADTNYYDIYVNEFDITSNSWGTESKIGEAGSGSVSLNLQGSSKGYIVNWYFYESLGLNNGYRRNMQLINPITGIAEWTNPDSTGCGNTIASKFEIYRNCSNTLDYLTYNSSLTSWEWLRQPGLNNVPLNSSYLAFNDKGDFASAYRNWNSGTYNGYLAIHYASSGWDTARVMGLGTNKEVVSNKADATNSGFTYHWRERNEVDNTLINGWIMVDLIP
ncbi:MAG: hypothetical protein OEX19_10920, partial [Gammaproteobacteria bacterium]|nr:hypothetical protein [Gammaproteobacteria bacterium]